MDIIAYFKDIFHYITSDWKKNILLGMVLFLADISNELTYFEPYDDNIALILIICSIILGFIGFGYVFRILEETVHGSQILPNFNRWIELLIHGIKESIITTFYLVIPLIIVIWELEFLSNIIHDSDFFIIISVIILLFCFYIFYLWLQGAMLNMAHHQGSLKSGFDLKIIFRRISAIGLGDMSLVFFLTVIIVSLVREVLTDTARLIPIIGDLILTFLVIPYLVIGSARLLGLIDKPVNIK